MGKQLLHPFTLIFAVCGNEIMIGQYADDIYTTMILHGSKRSFTSALLGLEVFRAISNDLQLKTTRKQKFSGHAEILWACAGRQDKLCPENDLLKSEFRPIPWLA